ncbi:hypothetical protein BsWGS_15238 [Bradybaena similaris]
MSARRPRSKAKRPDSEKKIAKKEEPEDPVIAQLKTANEALQNQNAVLQESINYCHNKLNAIVQHVVNNNIDNYEPAIDTPLIDIPESEVTRMITNLNLAATSVFQHYESKIEQLQGRLAQMSRELTRLLALKVSTESELHDMQKMATMDELKVAAKRLWFNSCSVCVPSDVTSQDTNGCIQPAESVVCSCPTSAVVGHDEIQEAIPALYLGMLSSKARSITMTPTDTEEDLTEPPQHKMPGETHIFQMHVGLRSLVIRELSQQRGNANDWRLMAARVGVPENLVKQWITMRAPHAMALVMRVWGDSAGATVRMLHRHLISPQMKAFILAKRISDFYQVD